MQIIQWLALAVWGLLTLAVVVFLIDRWVHPHLKSISNRDLQNYGLITIPFIVTIIVTTIIIKHMKATSPK